MNLKKKIIKILFKIPDPIYFFDEFLNRPGIFQTIKIFLKYCVNEKKIHFILILDILKKIYSLIVLILFFPIYFLFLIFLKKKKLTLISINTWQIGALIQQLDSIIKNNKSKKFFLICPNYLIEFESFLKIYRAKNLKYSKSSILYFFVYPLLVFKEFSEDAYEFEVLNKNSKFNKVHAKTNYNYNYKNLFKKLNLNNDFNHKKLVTIHIKDEFFIKGSSTRISNYKSYLKTIRWLIKKNYKVIRFVHPKSIRGIFKHKNYHELTTLNESEKIRQFYLIKKSNLFICNQSGPASYNFVLDTTFLQVNSYPLNVSFVTKSKDYLIYKFIKKNGKYISLKDMIKKNLHLYFNPQKKEHHAYTLQENSPQEIYESTRDVLSKNKSYYFSNFLKELNINIPASHSSSKIPKKFYEKISKTNKV